MLLSKSGGADTALIILDFVEKLAQLHVRGITACHTARVNQTDA